ncbi:unnamed protein product [Rotaria sp. Silwood1]|nr:unnamed protein product [Rotaria sp. Silwood1]CAF5074178.1 unnamed protein product [Rotaria sp. Silwood1]
MSHHLYDGEDHTAKYRLHRPGYPKELFEHIIDYYFNSKITNEKIPLALDVGCGSDQATADLSPFCERIIGIDVIDDYYESLVPLFPYKSTLRQYTIESSARQTYRKQNGEQVYQDMLNTLRHKLTQCCIKTEVKSDNDETIDFNSIKITLSRPIRLYLMKKNEI